MHSKCMLTTIDNPYDPYKQFAQWSLYDLTHDNCCALLARVARVSDQFTDEENDEEVERAIDEIIKYDFMNKYIKVMR